MHEYNIIITLYPHKQRENNQRKQRNRLHRIETWEVWRWIY
jgi:hypothetical protein